MKTALKQTAYEAPQAELLPVCAERNFLVSETGTASGQNITLSDEQDFDDFFNE